MLICLWLLLIVSVFTDLKKGKIHNVIVASGLIAGLLVRACTGGAAGLAAALGSAAAALILLFPLYLLRGIGAGDVKLIASAAVYLSVRELVACIAGAFLAGALSAVFVLLRTRGRRRTVRFALPVLISMLFVKGGHI